MSENEDDNFLDRRSLKCADPTPGSCLGAKSRTSVQIKDKIPQFEKGSVYSSPGQWEFGRKFAKKSTLAKPNPKESHGKLDGGRSLNADKQTIFHADRNYVVSDCWRTNSDDLPVKFVEPFKEVHVDDVSNAAANQKLDDADFGLKSPPYTKEFHLLTEVQKTRILRVVEDVVKKLANDDCFYFGGQSPEDNRIPGVSMRPSNSKFFCRKFSLPWVIIKVIEMILCHVIQIIFLSEESYYGRQSEFLPIVFTYYLTLFIVLISMVAQLSCFSYGEVQNPCYFMGVVSSCILTLITSLGIIIMLCSLQYYRSFLQILVLIFVGILLGVLFAELCLFYAEVKNVWNVHVVKDDSSDLR